MFLAFKTQELCHGMSLIDRSVSTPQIPDVHILCTPGKLWNYSLDSGFYLLQGNKKVLFTGQWATQAQIMWSWALLFLDFYAQKPCPGQHTPISKNS